MAQQDRASFGSAISRRGFITGLGATAALIASSSLVEAANSFHIVIYGGTSAGVIAACAAARDNLRVALIIGPNPIGGMTANGLSKSDLSDERYVGGLTRDFFRTMGRHYGLPGLARHFEPSVAEREFRRMLEASGCTVYDHDIAEVRGAVMDGNKIRVLRLVDGTVIGGRVFVDCSYEGDLMAQSGVPFATGRESQAQYGESIAGFGVGQLYRSIRARDAAGRLLPGIKPFPNRAIGSADPGVMSYNYRLSLSSDPQDQVPFQKPPGYDPNSYLLLLQMRPHNFHPGGALSVFPTKFDRNDDREPGYNWAFPNGSRAVRAAIIQRQKTFQAGRMYFFANDPRVLPSVREQANMYGLTKSEFTDNDNWSRQLYIREARRLRGMLKMRQQHVQTPPRFTDSAFRYIYATDSHIVQILEAPDGGVIEEGSLSSVRPNVKAWWMPLRAMLPLEQHCNNLIVPVCASVSRIFNTSYRMEPAYMMAGEAAGVLATVAVRQHTPPQRLDLPAVSAKLVGFGARI